MKLLLRERTSPAFTIVELLIVIVVIAILATITIVAYNGIQDRARAGVAQSDLRRAAEQLLIDQVTTGGGYPAGSGAPPASLKSSSGTDFEYTSDGTSYCLSAVNGSQAFHITDSGSIEDGVCPGHSGPVAGGGLVTCDSGFVLVPGSSKFGTNDFCIAKYEAKNVGGVAVSQASGLPWVYISQTNAISAASSACSGCHLVTEAEWLTVAHNVLNVASNWSGGSVGSGYIYSGHSDGSPASRLAASSNDSDGYSSTGNTSPSGQRRTLTLSNGEVIWDLAGNVHEWTSGQASGGQPGGSGWAWREWNTVGGTGSLSPNPFPSFGTPAASGWTSSNGIGRLYSDASDTSVRGFLRGSGWGSVASAGVLTLHLRSLPGDALGDAGFRLAK